jgi:TetR/AcrR family transcriptional repressor of bet genes
MPGTKIAEEKRREQILNAAYEIASEGGLAAITIRGVALRADTSPGLVSFYFESRVGLVVALLEWVLSTTTALVIGADILNIDNPLERLLAVLRQEMSRLARDPFRIRVVSEFWVAGIWDKPIRARMQKELDRYRRCFLPLAKAVLEAEPRRFLGVSPDALAAVSVGFIKGCAVQSMVDPKLNIGEFVRVAGQLLAPSQKKRERQTIPLGLAYGSLKLLSGPHG